jgi:hypothetical protein
MRNSVSRITPAIILAATLWLSPGAIRKEEA